ncbi:uncharacterized protein CTRU02_215776 [Colletotrichum truncatum]|uniref:Uncharacterized protein n=1 Tax=Colletotrichum truncatum TaxID=5467 RepID=A0ACC3YBN2_COLTU|nr:uncharacterized protein CTRU02_15100 [Colletotrichum truncatum]KAF6781460.1 hypothetical protein CTRU02_15100 [Colletotrichum truncatum]
MSSPSSENHHDGITSQLKALVDTLCVSLEASIHHLNSIYPRLRDCENTALQPPYNKDPTEIRRLLPHHVVQGILPALFSDHGSPFHVKSSRNQAYLRNSAKDWGVTPTCLLFFIAYDYGQQGEEFFRSLRALALACPRWDDSINLLHQCAAQRRSETRTAKKSGVNTKRIGITLSDVTRAIAQTQPPIGTPSVRRRGRPRKTREASEASEASIPEKDVDSYTCDLGQQQEPHQPQDSEEVSIPHPPEDLGEELSQEAEQDSNSGEQGQRLETQTVGNTGSPETEESDIQPPETPHEERNQEFEAQTVESTESLSPEAEEGYISSPEAPRRQQLIAESSTSSPALFDSSNLLENPQPDWSTEIDQEQPYEGNDWFNPYGFEDQEDDDEPQPPGIGYNDNTDFEFPPLGESVTIQRRGKRKTSLSTSTRFVMSCESPARKRRCTEQPPHDPEKLLQPGSSIRGEWLDKALGFILSSVGAVFVSSIELQNIDANNSESWVQTAQRVMRTSLVVLALHVEEGHCALVIILKSEDRYAAKRIQLYDPNPTAQSATVIKETTAKFIGLYLSKTPSHMRVPDPGFNPGVQSDGADCGVFLFATCMHILTKWPFRPDLNFSLWRFILAAFLGVSTKDWDCLVPSPGKEPVVDRAESIDLATQTQSAFESFEEISNSFAAWQNRTAHELQDFYQAELKKIRAAL